MNTNCLRWFSVAALAAVLASRASCSEASDPVNIMPLGDSITAGYTDNPTWSVPFAFGYRSGLYTRLTDADYSFQYVGASQEPWNGVFGVPTTVSSPDLRTINEDNHRGYGGASADALSKNISSWLATDSPDVVLLMVGINSITKGSSGNPASAEASLKALVQSIVVQRPTAHIIVAQITPYASYTESIVEYNNYIANTLVPYYVALGKNVTTVDQYSNFASGTTVDSSLYSNGINHPNATGYDKMAATWYSGIESLGTLTHSAGPASAVLSNGGFESPQYATVSHNVNPSGGSWSFTTGSSNAGTGIDYGNLYGAVVTNCTPASGTEMAFLQGAGAGYGTSSISQDMKGLIAGKTYTLTFSAKGIAGSSGADPFSVSIGGSTASFSGSMVLTPAISTSYTTYTTSFVATSSSMPLRFFDAGNIAVGKLTWIDEVKLGISTPTGSNLVTNGTFEATSFSSGTHNINPSGTGWRFTSGATGAGSGIDRGNPYGSTNAAAYAGSQYAFLQGAGEGHGTMSIEQDVSGFQIGKTYALTFEASAIEGYSGGNPIFASVGGNAVTFGAGAYVSPSGSYGLYCSDPFVATSSTMTLRFYDGGDVPVTFVSFIDDVQITAVPEPATTLLLLALVSCSGVVGMRRHR
jgi:lysophospholipase L1-like esterase